MLAYNNYKPTDKETEYVGKLINIQPNDISYMFFSDMNVDYINKQLIEKVMNITFERYGKKMAIQPQRKHILVSIMRHVYFKNIKNMFPAQEEVDMLNKEVLRLMVPMVVKELISHMRYIYDCNNIVPMDRPKPDNRKMGNVGSFNNLFTY